MQWLLGRRREHLSDVGGRPNKWKAEIRPLDLAMCGLLVTLMSSFGGVDLRENWRERGKTEKSSEWFCCKGSKEMEQWEKKDQEKGFLFFF